MSTKRSTLIIIWLSSQLLYAQNRESIPHEFITYAYPITGLTIDGDLNDWPEQSLSYPIKNKLWGVDPSSTEDLSASFQAGYSLSENALYLALTITDDNGTESETPTWNNQDNYTLYMNEQYDIKGSGIVRYTLAENFRDATNPSHHWDPMLAEYISWKKLDYQIKADEKGTTIELKYTLKEPISVGRVIGVGHMVVDQDDQENSVVGWVGRGGKSSYSQPGRIGSIVFADDNLTKGTLSGKVVWNDTTINLIPSYVSVKSAENSDRWFYLPVDKEGHFSAILPTGDWVLLHW
ncbi:MAG: sugar-binding protein [Bacteroidota bacterium]